MSADDISFVRRSLNSIDFDPSIHKIETECIICTCEFEPTDKVTQLKCHEKHIFHTECIDNWVK